MKNYIILKGKSDAFWLPEIRNNMMDREAHIDFKGIKLEVLSDGFAVEKLPPGHWTTVPYYKIRIKVSNTDYEYVNEILKSCSVFSKKDMIPMVGYILRLENSNFKRVVAFNDRHKAPPQEISYHVGSFEPFALQGLSTMKNEKIIQLHARHLEADKAPLNLVRDLRLDELVD